MGRTFLHNNQNEHVSSIVGWRYEIKKYKIIMNTTNIETAGIDTSSQDLLLLLNHQNSFF